jgi:hypothetical protein
MQFPTGLSDESLFPFMIGNDYRCNVTMTKRTTTISLSPEEKQRLDSVAKERFGESDTIPYGVTLNLLIDEYRDNS